MLAGHASSIQKIVPTFFICFINSHLTPSKIYTLDKKVISSYQMINLSTNFKHSVKITNTKYKYVELDKSKTAIRLSEIN